MQWIDYLYSLPRGRHAKNRENLKNILRKLDNPQDMFEYIHVAGTNGKGSVCAYLETCLIDCHQRVGVFTSPHLVKLNERIRINGADITDIDLVRIFFEVKALISEPPTFFEFMYIMAMLYFREKNVRFAIIEAGLGGLKDATNIVERPKLSIITAISLDHTEVLGGSRQLIAEEKAGIIKKGCPVIYYNDDKAVQAIIREKAQALGCMVYELKDSDIENINIRSKKIDFSLNSRYHRYMISLKTKAMCQVINSSLSILAMEVIWPAGPFFKSGLPKSIQKTRWPGRMEKVGRRLYIDGAHNTAAVAAFTDSIENCFSDVDLYLIFAVGKEKDFEAMIEKLCTLDNLKGVIITATGGQGSANLKELREIFEKNWNGLICCTYNIREALFEGHQWTRDSGVLCCIGSLYLAGSIKQILGGTAND